MKLITLFYMSGIIKNDTEITLLNYDTMEQIKGRWLDDRILAFGSREIKYFIYHPDQNRVAIMVQGIKEIDKEED